MTTPDRRPIGALTPEILSSSSHWCLLWCGRMLTMPTADIEANGSCVFACGMVFGYGKDSRSTCYPCTLQPSGLVVPEPWPVLEGEEEIEEWRDVAGRVLLPVLYGSDGYSFWRLMDVAGIGPAARAQDARPGYHPAPRKSGKWVWEKDKC